MAQSSVKISFPPAGFVLSSGTLLVASGRADMSIIGVRGECRPRSGTGSVIKGTMTSYDLVPGNNSQPSFYRWIIGFRGFTFGEYELTVTGIEGAGDTVSFEVGPPAEYAGEEAVATRPSGRVHPDDVFFTIDYPQAGDDLTAEEDYFVAWGECGELELDPDNTSLTDSQGNSVPIQQAFSDAQVLQFWSVSFDTIPSIQPPVVYSFHAQNTAGTGDTESGLSAS